MPKSAAESPVRENRETRGHLQAAEENCYDLINDTGVFEHEYPKSDQSLGNHFLRRSNVTGLQLVV